jgi:hypothetical protein
MSDTRDWWPSGYDLPAFRVKRQTYGLMTGGDWVRGSSVETLPHTALRYPSTTPEYDPTTDTSKAILYTRPFDYNTVEILWGWPVSLPTWEEVALVRSTFGHPSTPRDGQTVFRAMRNEFEELETLTLLPAPIVYDQLLPTKLPNGAPGMASNGRFLYYTLFFRTNPIDWVVGMSDACLLPRDFQHREYLWDLVPPYYQWIDDNYRVGAGFLRQFLTVFGFVLDNTREFVEGYLDLHYIDKTPMSLLKGLGANYGLPYESGIGDIRYRGLVANVPDTQHTRGTAVGLERLIEAVSKYETEVTGSLTMMLFPDDSDFYLSTGNWGGIHPDAVAPVLAQEPSVFDQPLVWSSIFVSRVQKAPPAGRGVMRVYTAKANETANLLVTVGDARIRDDPNTLLSPTADTVPAATSEYHDAAPLTAGISVTAGRPYGFSVYMQAPETNFTVQPCIIWIGPSGSVYEVIDVSLGVSPGQSVTSVWKQYIAQGVAPEKTGTTPEARYLIPAIYVSGRTAHTLTNRSAAIDVAAAMVYPLGDENTEVSVTPPDRYLTLGDVGEKLGAPTESFEGFVIGSPQRGE